MTTHTSDTPTLTIITPESLTQTSLHSLISHKLGSGDWEKGRDAIIFCARLVKGKELPPVTHRALVKMGMNPKDSIVFWNYCVGDNSMGKYWTRKGKELLLSLLSA